MKKRSLVDQLQAWRAEEEQGARAPAATEARVGLGAHAPSEASASASDEEPDYMSDAFLAQLEERDAPRQLTYAEKRAKVLREHQEHQRREMEEADARRSKRQRGPLAGEEEARQVGMAVNVLERAAAPADREAPQAGSGTTAAVRMMLAMGYKPGTALGADASAGSSEPIAPDQRWLSHAGDTGPRRLGIGHVALSQQIAEAARQVPAVLDDPETQADRFRQSKAAEATQRHMEQVLRKARQICRELDEEEGFEYSPLWLDPSSLPPEHAYFQASYVRENERGQEDALALLDYAFGEGEDGKDEEGEVRKANSTTGSEAGEAVGREAPTLPSDEDAPRAGLGRCEAADAGRASPTPPPVSSATQRRLDAARFCTLSATTRLALTHAHLRTTYAYCVYCGERYATYDELLAVCPGEAEDAHE
ncbi:hypothetical protein MBRA1_003090 [Malassezia brasiliensis]|uniref:G-patch domain-containing protein n=1 Tax=Malassezia brasiliensis TaxID=1821822 RepID=A0AAF0DUM8_9BASI|nr:hypothetical protein MBRA1_003090 [Malassezia brasiliensis]